METAVLEEAGLTPAEAKVYMTLLKTGPTTAGPIIKKTNLHRGTTYDMLEKLVEKGVVNYIFHGKRKVFSAQDPEVFLRILKEREERLREELPNLERIRKESEGEQQASVYEGYQGFKTAHWRIVETLKSGEEYWVFGARGGIPQDIYEIYFRNFYSALAEKKVKSRIIINEDVKETLGRTRAAYPLAEVRYTPSGVITPATVNVYANTVLTVLWGEKPVAVEVRSKIMADSFKKYFKLLWGMSKKL
ncbi:MAG: helix-turn-helix domain-containing protein [Candidatus Altiarchaeota archaeon]